MASASTKEMRIEVSGAGEVSALLVRPAKAHCVLALAHGAGAGMHHAFLEELAAELAQAGVATLRYQFPYMEQRRKAPDKPAVLTATVASAAHAAAQAVPGLPLFAGGKSMGGRMTSQAAALGLLPDVRGIVFFGFPLHPPKQPGTQRADHLAQVAAPMLFLQGTRDAFAPLPSIRAVCAKLSRRATLLVFEGADHSFHVPKSSGKTDAEVLRDLAQAAADWTKKVAVARDPSASLPSTALGASGAGEWRDEEKKLRGPCSVSRRPCSGHLLRRTQSCAERRTESFCRLQRPAFERWTGTTFSARLAFEVPGEKSCPPFAKCRRADISSKT